MEKILADRELYGNGGVVLSGDGLLRKSLESIRSFSPAAIR